MMNSTKITTNFNTFTRPIIQPYSKGTVILFKLFRTIVYFLQMGLSFLLMLAVMSFNVGVFVAVISGLTVGYALFVLQLDSTDAALDPETTNHL